MRKFNVNVNGKSYVVEVEEAGDGVSSSVAAPTAIQNTTIIIKILLYQYLRILLPLFTKTNIQTAKKDRYPVRYLSLVCGKIQF